VRIEENKQLARFTTLGIGGPARWFVEAHTEADIAEAAAWSRTKGVQQSVLGGGSNLLVADAGFEGLVLRIALKGIRVLPSSFGAGGQIFEAAAGEDWDQFVQQTVVGNCAGLECLAGIPGTVGGTPVQNVGAYGQEVGDSITRVRAFDLVRNAFVNFRGDECGFAYRRSRFNTTDHGRYIVTKVEYALNPDSPPNLKYADLQRAFPSGSDPSLKEVAETVRRIRRSKGMLLVEGDPDCRSAGSFFKNPIVTGPKADYVASAAGSEPPRFSPGPDHPTSVKLPAAWLIEKAGFTKGFAMGRAAISAKHTLALVNLGGARAADILSLAQEIRSAVSDRFGIHLEIEPVMLGFDH
jgi:UDP-N-acetylmuramate dehydrogenase